MNRGFAACSCIGCHSAACDSKRRNLLLLSIWLVILSAFFLARRIPMVHRAAEQRPVYCEKLADCISVSRIPGILRFAQNDTFEGGLAPKREPPHADLPTC
jgi:hypothetical protein